MKQVTKTILVCGMALICYTGGDTTLFAQTKMINQVDFFKFVYRMIFGLLA